MSNGDQASAKAADYLFNQLKKRTIKNDKFNVQRTDGKVNSVPGNIVYCEVVPDLAWDYQIKNDAGRLAIFAKEPNTFVWLSYMLIDHIGSFHALDHNDLPPNFLDFKTKSVRFALAYREPHLPVNNNSELSAILLTNQVDRDWGLWGHHFSKVFRNKIPDHARALVHGKRENEQFCFSADETFQAARSYIMEEYGQGDQKGAYFMIAPNDNHLVCTCAECLRHGNTKTSASGAVGYLLNKLAKEFPKHLFFTVAYQSVLYPPPVALADNVGVFLSTIDLPKKVKLASDDPAVVTFVNLASTWQAQVKHRYVWDYISNFDDYLTPLPLLERVKQQVIYFNSLGVDGAFLNGSGYQYSSFGDVQQYVLAALMIDPHLSVSQLVKQYLDRFYPTCGRLMYGYLMGQEEGMRLKNYDTGVYVPFREIAKSYLDTAEFKKFYVQLEQLSEKANTEEKIKVEKLLVALSYTRLQIVYEDASKWGGLFSKSAAANHALATVDMTLKRLHRYTKYEDLTHYKEADGLLDQYLREWESVKRLGEQHTLSCSLRVEGLSTLQNYSDAYLLHDQMLGFTSDFNQGWFLAGEDIAVNIALEKGKENLNLKMRFLVNERHRMLVPDKVEVFCNNVKCGYVQGNDIQMDGGIGVLNLHIPMQAEPSLQIKVYKHREIKNSVIACDEIVIQ